MLFIPQLPKLVSAKIFHFLFYGGLFLFIFSFSFTLAVDPDLGWHLRFGEEVVVNKNILKVDTFSHTFKGQSVIDTEWLAEAVFFIIFSRYSFLGLSLISALFTSMAFWLPLVVLPADLLLKFLFVFWAVIGSSPVLEVGARAQNVSLVFFSLLFILLLKFVQSKQNRYLVFIPLLFFIWAKAHPGFFVGFMLLAGILLLELIFFLWERVFNLKKSTSLVFFAIIFALTLVSLNIGAKNDMLGRLLSSQLLKTHALPAEIAATTPLTGSVRKTISEWKPPLLIDFPGTLFFLGLIFSVAMFIKPSLYKADVKYLTILGGFIYFSTLSRRNVPFFFLIFLPIAILYSQERLNKTKNKRLLPYFTCLALILALSFAVTKITRETKRVLAKGASMDTYCQALKYPCQAVEFIKEIRPSGNMFNHYNWGGYLIWQLPQYPVFIDGRVPGSNAFAEFEQVVALKPGWEQILAKYNVGFLLMPRNLLFEQLMGLETNWVAKYKDEIAVIYMRK